MKSLGFFAAIFMVGSAAQADVLKCSFTEPFYSLEFDTAVGALQKTEPDMSNTSTGDLITTVLAKGVTVKELTPSQRTPLATFARYALVDTTGKELLTLELNYEGSDGMSEWIFPYDAEMDGHRGGCESDVLKGISPEPL